MKPLYEMANLPRQESGQPFDIWVDSAGSARGTTHNEFRVKAYNNGVTIVAGFKNGKFSNFQTPEYKITKFGKNRELKNYLCKIKPLLDLHWENKITDGVFILSANLIAKGCDVHAAIEKAIDFLR